MFHPPHADGRKIFSPASADKRVDPGLALIVFSSSPLIFILTSPWGNSFDSAKFKIRTKIKITPVKTEIAKILEVVIIIECPQMT